jgi:CO/xanthine dehydrogenase Mo-binding subunit/xanthine dehydrogenase iron-sulfur cluster and FAD-binding subunit A
MAAYFRPSSLAEALAIRACRPVTVLAGGTDVYPARATRVGWGDMRRDDILDIGAVGELKEIVEEDGRFRFGALSTWRDMRRAPLPPAFAGYKKAARDIGGAQVQNRGTLAGNICTASPAGDGIPCLLSLDAEVELASERGRRVVPLCAFIDGYRRTVCGPDEIVTAILVPRPPAAAHGDFLKLGARRYLVISIVMAAAVIATDEAGAVTHARIAVGACSAVAQRLPQLEQALLGQPLAAAPDLVEACQFAKLTPIDDARGSSAFRAAAAVDVVRDVLAGIVRDPTNKPAVELTRGAGPHSSAPPCGEGNPIGASGQGKPRQTAGAIRFTVNGEAVAVSADPFASLAGTLRDRLGLTGTKIGCDAGDCGACTVLLDGQQVCACLIATGQAEGAAIHTVEGPGPGGLTDRLRQAFLAHGAAQCGICTPGMLMAAADCLSRNPAPSRTEVEDALGGVLCRCTGYIKIVEAVMDVAGGVRPSGSDPMLRPPLCPGVRPPGSDPIVGARIARVDGWAKVSGTDKFGADEAPDGALHMRVVRSPHARATFALGDLAAVVAATPGLEAILTHRDVPGENRFGIFQHTRDQPVLAEGHVRFRGEAVVALVGTREAVERVSDADLPIAWTVETPRIGVEAARAPGAPAVHAGKPDNILAQGFLQCGDVDAARPTAVVVVEGGFETAFVEHAYIEPEAGWAQAVGDRVEVACCTQAPYLDREETARVLGVEPSKVRIRPTACGGGFGGKLDVSVQPLLAVAARVTGKPVRIVYTRTESMASTTKRHPARLWARASAGRDGRLVSFELDGDFNTGAYASWGPTVAGRVPVHGSGPYKVANVRNRARAVYTNETPAGAFRGFGVPQAAIAHETLLDDLAAQLGLDRWHIRRVNAIGNGDTTPSGQRLDRSAGLPECLEALKADWHAALDRVAAFNGSASGSRRRRGVGIGCMWYGCGNTSVANPSTMRIALGRDGRLTFFNGAVDIGQGSSTVLLQIAAHSLGLAPERFEMVVGDTDLTFDAGKTSASRQTYVSGNAARLAAEDLRAQLLMLANAGPDAVLSLDGTRLTIADGEASRVIELAALDSVRPGGSDTDRGVVLEGVGTWDPPATALDANGQGSPYGTYGFAAQMSEVEVDMRLGTVRVLSIVAAHDVGRAVNPTLTEGQIHGGIAQGLGMALMEEYLPGRTENLHDYLIPTVGDMPAVKMHLIEDAEPTGPYGAKGVGEPALIATAPAILGAIRHATGVTLRQVPVLPHRLWAALRAEESTA